MLLRGDGTRESAEELPPIVEWVASRNGARNVIPPFLTANGPIRVVRFRRNPDGSRDGGVHALFTVAGNPALSTPNGGRLASALGSLELMVSLDIYLNETTRHAHVVLPGLSPLEQAHFPLAFTQLAVRNFARYSKPVFAPPAGQPAEWQTLLRLSAIATGQGAAADVDALDEFVFEQQLGKVRPILPGDPGNQRAFSHCFSRSSCPRGNSRRS